MKQYDTIHEAYLGTLADVLDNPDYTCSPRGLKIYECLDYSFKVLNPIAEPLITKDPERNKVIADYTKKEVALYNSCSNQVKDFAKASKFWEKIANVDGTVNSAYGYLIWENKSYGNPIYELGYKDGEQVMVKSSVTASGRLAHKECRRTPWQWCLESLQADKDTRQAILKFNLPEHFYKGNKDVTCTLSGFFSIRNDKLNLSITMRSNDLMLGLAYDLPWFVSLMDKMVADLQPTYPNLTKGHYTHTVHSMHIYEKNIDAVNKMLGR